MSSRIVVMLLAMLMSTGVMCGSGNAGVASVTESVTPQDTVVDVAVSVCQGSCYEGDGLHGYMKLKEVEIHHHNEFLEKIMRLVPYILRGLLYIFIACIVVAVVVFMVKNMPSMKSLFRRKAREDDVPIGEGDVRMDDERIMGHDYNKEVEAALAANDYRRAIKIVYLTTLALLHQRKLVKCEDSKTPTEYCIELDGGDSKCKLEFRAMTGGYLESTYAPGEPGKTLFERMAELRKVIFKMLPMLMALLLSSCSREAEWQFCHPFVDNSSWFACEKIGETLGRLVDDYEERADVTKQELIDEVKVDYIILSVRGDDVDGGGDLSLPIELLKTRLSEGANTLIASERLYVESEGNKYSMISGDGYLVKRIEDDVNDDGKLTMSTLSVYRKTEKYRFPSELCNCVINTSRVNWLVAQLNKQMSPLRCTAVKFVTRANQWVSCVIKCSNGSKLVISSVPLLFTDYSMCYDEGKRIPLVMEHMAGLGEEGRSLCMTYYSGGEEQSARNPKALYRVEGSKRVIRESKSGGESSEKKMNFNIWMAMLLGLILGLPFVLHRRQRAMRIINRPRNMTTDLIKHAAPYYDYRKEYKPLLVSRCAVFADKLQAMLKIDIMSNDSKEDVVELVMSVMDINDASCRSRLRQIIHFARTKEGTVNQEEFIQLVNVMERIERKLENKNIR